LPETFLILRRTGKRETMSAKENVTKYMVVSDSTVRNVRTEHADMKVECFSGIKTEELHSVFEKRDLASPETVIIHVGTQEQQEI
jgi:hypothetical protein